MTPEEIKELAEKIAAKARFIFTPRDYAGSELLCDEAISLITSALNDRWVKINYSDLETYPKIENEGYWVFSQGEVVPAFYSHDSGFIDADSNEQITCITHYQQVYTPPKPIE